MTRTDKQIEKTATFTCTANTKKGNFQVKITVWKEYTDGYMGTTSSWESEAYMTFEGEDHPVNFDRRNSKTVENFSIFNKKVLIAGDFSEPVNYIKREERKITDARAKAMQEDINSESYYNL